jgi:hypothetical protein
LSHTSVDSSFNGSVKKFLNSSCWAVTIVVEMWNFYSYLMRFKH